MIGKRKYRLLAAAIAVVACVAASAQSRPRAARRAARQSVAKTESVSPAPDSATLARRDSIARADSLHRSDSLAMLSKSSLDRPAFSQARDSIVEVFSNGQKLIYYYGDVSVTYQNMKLTAEYMEYDMNSGTVYARGVLDTISGEWKGRPVMEQGGKSYNMEEVRYNFNSSKARISNMVTNEEDGILHGKNIKMMPDRSINITKGKYTVCDKEHPHYWLELSAAKVITKPSQKTVFGPAHMVVEDVHLPFVALPFGFIPKRPQRATGMLMPTFGEEAARGFYMRDAGMYFVFGDYFDLSVTGDLYTLGSWGIDINSRYKVNYKFNGSFGLNYSNDQTGEKGSADFFQTKNFGLKWSHSQDSKAHPGTSFSASVNFSSPSNNRYNSTSVSEALENQISSSISYSKNWNGKINLSINALHNQNSRDSSYSFTLPNITFSVSTFYPFKRKNRVGKERFYERFSLGYNTTLQNRISFKASEFGQEGFTDKFQNGMAHNFSIGLPNFTIANYFNVNPSVSYGQNWFFRSTDYVYNSDTDRVEAQQGKQFGTFGITQNYSGSVSMSTRLYGLFNFGKHRRIQAIRHVVSPSLSMSFSPEKGTYANGWRTLHYTDKSGQEKTYEYNRYAGQMYSPPGKGRSATASLSIGNNLEAKVRNFADTTGSGSKKVKLLDQLNISTGYNFLADSLKMSTVNMSMSTSIFGKISISGSASFDPYQIAVVGGNRVARIDRFNVQDNPFKPLRMTSASASLSYSISGSGKIDGNDGSRPTAAQTGGADMGAPAGGGSPADYYRRIYYHPVTGEYIPGGWLYYTNPNVPWSVNMNYNFSFRKNYKVQDGKIAGENQFVQTLGLSGNIKLTPKMALNASTGFDLQAMKMTTTQFSATYDLHCFNISVSWVPTGTWKSYSFRIAANAAALADILRFKKSSSYWDN